MKTAALLFSAAVLFAVAPASPLVAAEEPSAARYITSLLTVQCAAWNRGDLDQFMEAYAQTDTLRFASGFAKPRPTA